MRIALICLATGAALLAGCSKAPATASASAASDASVASNAAAAVSAAPATQAAAPASGAPVSGTFSVVGKPAALTQAVAYKGEPESGKPVTVVVLSAKDQAGSANAPEDALFGKFGDALVVKVFADGEVYSVDVMHSALDAPGGSAQLFGVVKMADFSSAGGQLSGHMSSGGDTDVHGQAVNIDLTFHAKAP